MLVGLGQLCSFPPLTLEHLSSTGTHGTAKERKNKKVLEPKRIARVSLVSKRRDRVAGD